MKIKHHCYRNYKAKAVEEMRMYSIMDLTNEDAVMVELGIAIKLEHKIIIGINSDIPLSRC